MGQSNMMYQMGLRLFGSQQHANRTRGEGHQLTDLYVIRFAKFSVNFIGTVQYNIICCAGT